MIRAVLDANVFVSAVLSPRGIPARILATWRAEGFSLALSAPILREIGAVLHYPKILKRHGWPEDRVRLFLDDLAHLAVLTPGTLTLKVMGEDPPDNRYLECAVEAEAGYIVSGDHHLLNLQEYRGIHIVTPRVFLEVLAERERHPPPGHT